MVPRSYLPRCLGAHLTAQIEHTVSPGQRKLDTLLRREWETLASPLGRLAFLWFLVSKGSGRCSPPHWVGLTFSDLSSQGVGDAFVPTMKA